MVKTRTPRAAGENRSASAPGQRAVGDRRAIRADGGRARGAEPVSPARPAVGARVRVHAVRARVRGLHGRLLVRPEALPALDDADVGRDGPPLALAGDRVRPRTGGVQAAFASLLFNYKPSPLKIEDNGHTIQVNYAPGSFVTVAGKLSG